jgi:hypothetical protein
MKQSIYKSSLLLLSLLILLSSCFMGLGGQGSMSFQVPALASASRGTGTYMRITLGIDGEVYPINGNRFLEIELTSEQQEVEIIGLPAGAEVTVFLSKGTAPSSNSKSFVTQEYAESLPISISPGVNALVDLTLSNTMVNQQRIGQEIKDIVWDGEDLYLATVNSVVDINQTTFANITTPTTLGGNVTINGLTPITPFFLNAAPQQVLINSSSGIRSFDGTSVTQWTNDPDLQNVDILDSTIYVNDNPLAADTYTMVFQRSAGVGGEQLDGSFDPVDADWANVDLSEFVSGLPVYSFANTPLSVAYIATKIGSLELEEADFNDTDSFDFLNDTVFFDVPNREILTLGFQYVTQNILYVGTDNGVYFAVADLADTNNVIDPADSFQLLTGTNIGPIQMMEIHNIDSSSATVTPSADQVYAAFLTPLYLIVYDLENSQFVTLPRAVGLSENINSITIKGSDLFVSGDYGLQIIDLSGAPFNFTGITAGPDRPGS